MELIERNKPPWQTDLKSETFFGLRNTRLCGKKHVVTRNHIFNISSFTNRKGQFIEHMPTFIKVKKRHTYIWYLKVVTTVESSLWGKYIIFLLRGRMYYPFHSPMMACCKGDANSLYDLLSSCWFFSFPSTSAVQWQSYLQILTEESKEAAL